MEDILQTILSNNILKTVVMIALVIIGLKVVSKVLKIVLFIIAVIVLLSVAGLY